MPNNHHVSLLSKNGSIKFLMEVRQSIVILDIRVFEAKEYSKSIKSIRTFVIELSTRRIIIDKISDTTFVLNSFQNHINIRVKVT